MMNPVLKLDGPLVRPAAPNYRLPQFPPPEDFPIVVDAEGKTVSRYGDPHWNFAPIARATCLLDFGVAPKRKNGIRLSSQNSAQLKVVMAYWLYGERPIVQTGMLKFVHCAIVPLFRLCTQHGILASEIERFPRVRRQLVSHLPPSKVRAVATILYELYNAREFIGFTLLTLGSIKELLSAAPEHVPRQFAYIPPRLWKYQVSRCRELLEDFLSHQHAFEALFAFCISAYETAYGSLENAYRREDAGQSPFGIWSSAYVGPFHETAHQFGVADVMARWVVAADEENGDLYGIRILGKYFGAVQFVGAIYLASFSGMRVSEVSRLRADCLTIDEDKNLGRVFLLRGETSKTVRDKDALWVTSPSAQLAVDAMTAITRMRLSVATANPSVSLSPDHLSNPYLITRSYEPWGIVREMERQQGADVRPGLSYRHWRNKCPRLLDPEAIRITQDDLQTALLVTPSLDESRFQVGAEWPFAIHQLRRTLNVNATHSGIVSLQSLQYEMKHQTPAMSIYYGRGHSRLSFNRAITVEYAQAMVEALAFKAVTLSDPAYTSPFGPDHKARLLAFMDQRSTSELLAMAKTGQLAIRETVLGVCLNRAYCPFGGIDYIVECGRCDKALIDRRKRDRLQSLAPVFEQSLADRPPDGSPLHESLNAQQATLQEILDDSTLH